MSDNFNPSGTGMNTEYTQGPAAGTHSEGFNQSQDMGAYDEMQRSQGGDMGGGGAVAGSGVAGGYENNQNQSQPATGMAQTGEKQDWLDKGIEAAGRKFGINVVSTLTSRAFCLVNSSITVRATRMQTKLEIS